MKVEMLKAYMEDVAAKRNTLIFQINHNVESGKWDNENCHDAKQLKDKIQFANELLMYLSLHPSMTTPND